MSQWSKIILFATVLYFFWGWGQAAAHIDSRQSNRLSTGITEVATNGQPGSDLAEARAGISIPAVQSEVAVPEKGESVPEQAEKIAQQFERDTSATGRMAESGDDSHWFWYILLAIAILGFIYFIEKMFRPRSDSEQK